MDVDDNHILLIEDDQGVAELVALHLADQCDEVVLASDGHEGMQLATSRAWNLIILEVCLPGPDGLQICREVRRRRDYQPMMILTSKSSELDRVLGLETGADDYLTKPFSVLELVARVRALLRRVKSLRQLAPASDNRPGKVKAGPLTIDPSRREVRKFGHIIQLTVREFDLLNHFAQHPGRVFNRSELLDFVWGYGHEGYEHTVNSHINRLRCKIETHPASPEIIITVWGVGYKLADSSPVQSEQPFK